RGEPAATENGGKPPSLSSNVGQSPSAMSITGLYYLIRFHPYWSREARRQLGVGSVLTVAIAQFVCSLPIAFLTPVGFLWPFLLIGGFVLGTVIGIFLCLQ